MMFPCFPVLRFPPLQIWSPVFQSRVFHSCDLVPRFPVLRFPIPRFQYPRSQSTNVTDRRTDRQTDRQTTCDRNTALCTKVHRAVKKKPTHLLCCFNPFPCKTEGVNHTCSDVIRRYTCHVTCHVRVSIAIAQRRYDVTGLRR